MAQSPVLLHLRRALAGLNDPEQLGANPLAERLETFRDENALARAAQLRRVIVNLIESLRPAGDPVETSPQWRQYIILYDRYVARRPLWQVEQKLHLGERQVRREHRRAVAELALRFQAWLDAGAQAVSELTQPDAPGMSLQPESPVAEPLDLLEAVQRLSPAPSVFGLRDLFLDLQAVVSEIARQSGAGATIDVRVDPPDLTAYADRGILHQLLFKLLQALAQAGRDPSRSVRLSARPVDTARDVRAVLLDIQSDVEVSDDDDRLQLCRWLARSLQSDLAREAGAGASFRLVLPAGARLRKVMIVDDEPVAIELFESYLVGLDFSVAGVTRPGEAVQRALEIRPDVIVLDVMMPAMDGWELLQQLRHAPGLEGVPVIACSVLRDADLARALGAASFLHKPVLRHQLIAALEAALKAARETAQNQRPGD